MPQSQTPIRLSDLPRDECLKALQQRATDAKMKWQESRMAAPSLWQRMFGG